MKFVARHWRKFTVRNRKKFVVSITLMSCVYFIMLLMTWRDRHRLADWNQILARTQSWPDVTIDDPLPVTPSFEPVIAVGGAITSKRLTNVTEENIVLKFQFFHTFLPSFCGTASPHFIYKFYLGYDLSDSVFAHQRLRDAFGRQVYLANSSNLCRQRNIVMYNVSLVGCDYADKPAWSQNDAMLDAYLDHVDYFYRINDDTIMRSMNWTEKFIATLDSYDPPRVGVAGPKHVGGKSTILTYDFVHRTHVDVFGFYYPRTFTDWFADDWITYVYQPNRSTKVENVDLVHFAALGQRYKQRSGINLDGQLKHDVRILQRYIKAVRSDKMRGTMPSRRKVIAMSLYGQNARYIWGALRNAQLVGVYLREWTLRVYIPGDRAPAELAVPARVTRKLRHLGAQVARVSLTGNSMAPRHWRLLVANDQHVDYFLVRDADSRLTEREASAIRDWVIRVDNLSRSGVIHCIRDHPWHAQQAIVDGLWGGKPRPLHDLLGRQLTQMMNTSSASGTMAFLNDVLWPAVSYMSYCHDSVSECGRWSHLTSRHSFLLLRQHNEYVGQKFDSHQQLLGNDSHLLKPDITC